jgi:hypothetical protein
VREQVRPTMPHLLPGLTSSSMTSTGESAVPASERLAGQPQLAISHGCGSPRHDATPPPSETATFGGTGRAARSRRQWRAPSSPRSPPASARAEMAWRRGCGAHREAASQCVTRYAAAPLRCPNPSQRTFESTRAPAAGLYLRRHTPDSRLLNIRGDSNSRARLAYSSLRPQMGCRFSRVERQYSSLRQALDQSLERST